MRNSYDRRRNQIFLNWVSISIACGTVIIAVVIGILAYTTQDVGVLRAIETRLVVSPNSRCGTAQVRMTPFRADESSAADLIARNAIADKLKKVGIKTDSISVKPIQKHRIGLDGAMETSLRYVILLP